jgi:hypothetical protein
MYEKSHAIMACTNSSKHVAHTHVQNAKKNEGTGKGGKIVNDFGQEEVGISKRDARRSALRDMYAHSTEAHVVTSTKKRASLVSTNQKYMPRSYEGGKYDSQTFWGLSSTKAKTAKPLIRVGESCACDFTTALEDICLQSFSTHRLFVFSFASHLRCSCTVFCVAVMHT